MRRTAMWHLGLAAALLLLLGGRAYSQTTTAPPTTTTAAPTTTTSAPPMPTTTTLPTAEWRVILPTDCTKAGDPADCCVSATGAANEQCNMRMDFAHFFEVYATFEPSTLGTYRTGGSELSATQFKRLGLNTVVATLCNPTKSGRQVFITQPTTEALPPVLTIHLFESGETEVANGAILVTSQGVGKSDAFTCLIIGR